MDRFFGPRVGRDNEEFLAADAAENVVFPQAVFYTEGDHFEHEITEKVAMGVVDQFEVVDVEHNERQGTV